MSLRRIRNPKGAVRFTEEPAADPPVSRPAPRAARMLAVAHALSDVIAQGAASRGELARALEMSCGRLSQLLDLVLLAPDIQEELLFMMAAPGADPVPERSLRYVMRPLAWTEQRRRWAALRAQGGRGTRDEPWAGRPSAREAKKEASDALIDEKLGKGYVEAT
jgi:hypothetical protein